MNTEMRLLYKDGTISECDLEMRECLCGCTLWFVVLDGKSTKRCIDEAHRTRYNNERRRKTPRRKREPVLP